ncbi:universal stress protein [Dactylosporangium sp. NBC_01737]|uniref:universal stress protein n=1 Tax=Dactylosporangium sp. NBC_01737 TaxID=2975959 RepID=UPI002E138272|nr:universal stress protein [Dactylosporangium sp. NBC_01737]
MANTNLPVVVGVDGAVGGMGAVVVAAAEAAERHRPLRIVHVVDRADPALAGVPIPPVRQPPDPRRVLSDAAGVASEQRPGLLVDTQVRYGPPAITLLGISAEACLLVVGSRGLGGFAGLLLGSTSSQVASHARCPVMIVRGVPEPGGEVLAAVDALQPADTVLSFAFREAALRAVPLRALFGWTTLRHHPHGDPFRPFVDDFEAGREEAQRALAEVLAGWSAQFPTVKVLADVEHTLDVARTLVEASASAGLVIVGSHRRSDLHGVLLGSAAYALAHRSECPVAVVHPDDRQHDV